MNKDALMMGLEFCSQYKLTPKEIEALRHITLRPFTAIQLGHLMNTNGKTVHATIQRLRMKSLVIMKGKDKREKVYMFNEEKINEQEANPVFGL